MERWRPPRLLTLLCLLSVVQCDCNPYEGCEPKAPKAGERCVFSGFMEDGGGGYSVACRQGTVCDRSTGFCVPTPQLGEPCLLGELNCADELLCASRSGVCVTPGGAGADCDVAACNEGLVCNGGTCTEPESPGSGCDATTACSPETTCNGAGDPTDPRRGECLAPQTEGGPCDWRPWTTEEYPTGCAFGFSCRPPDPPDRLAPGVDATYLDCRDAADGDDPCFGLVGTCVADGSLAGGEPCVTGAACDGSRCSNAGPPWGLPEIDGYACTGDDCAEFPWPGFCVGEGENQEGRFCSNIGDEFPCARGLVCSSELGRNECVPLGRADDGEPCGELFEDYVPVEESCIAGLECVEETLRCRRRGPGAEGDVCTVFADCGAGLGCSDAGRCEPYPTVGEPCGPELPCTNAQCNRRDSRCSAIADARGDAPCADDTDCPRGTFCWVENTRQCRGWGRLDGICNGAGVVCDFGLVCRDSGVGSNQACLPPL